MSGYGGMKTLFIGELLGNASLWKKVIAQEAQKADRIVQLGNLLSHYSFRSYEDASKHNLNLMRLVNAYRYTQDDWLQIVGPNEMIALNDAAAADTVVHRLLRESWFRTKNNPNPLMSVAVVEKGRLITHGGLTHGLWVKIGSPQTAEEAAESLDEIYRNTVFQGECYNLGHKPNFSANPIWANPLYETYPSWITADELCPFGQIHAGSNLNSEEGRLLRGEDSSYFKWFERVLYKPYGSISQISGTQFIGLSLNLPLEEASSLPDGSALYMEDA